MIFVHTLYIYYQNQIINLDKSKRSASARRQVRITAQHRVITKDLNMVPTATMSVAQN